MRRPWRRALIAAGVTIAAVAGTIAWAYDDWKARAAVETRRLGLPAYAANGLRHSLAAADTYAVLRLTGLSSARAANVTEKLGVLNEYKEYYFRPVRRRDPTREIYKDLHNNVVGILSAEKLEGEGRLSSADPVAFLGQMTANNVVLRHFSDARVPDFPDGGRPEASNLALALDRFRRERRGMREAIPIALAGGLAAR